MRPIRLLALASLAVAGLASFPALAGPPEPPGFQIEIEGGPFWQSRNEVQIPNDATGTRFSLVDVVGEGSWSAFRVYAGWRIGERSVLRAMAAPLEITETSTLGFPVEFAGSSFAAGEPTEAVYKFNSYRLSYRYRYHHGERWTWWIGFTAKIRDARVALSQPTVDAEKTDVGFVPLLHVAGDWRIGRLWSVDLDVDALAGGPGRAEDVSLKLRRRLGDRWSLAAGYRLVEGGADVDEVYSFAWLHYAVASVRLAL